MRYPCGWLRSSPIKGWRNVYENCLEIITYKYWQKAVYQLVQECAGFQRATGYGKAMQGFCIVWWLGLGFSSYHISLAKCDTCPSTLKSVGLAWACLTTSKLGHIVLVHEKTLSTASQGISYNLFMTLHGKYPISSIALTQERIE